MDAGIIQKNVIFIYKTVFNFSVKKNKQWKSRMDSSELHKKIEDLSKENAELRAIKQEYISSKQSFSRMSVRLRKLCKRLEPKDEIVLEMQKIAEEIRDLTRKVTE